MPPKKKSSNEADKKPKKTNSVSTETTEATTSELKAQEYTVTYKGGLNVRSTPSLGEKVVKVLKYGETVPVSEITASGWGKTPDGYIKMQFVRKSK